jgi:hypothetical protein
MSFKVRVATFVTSCVFFASVATASVFTAVTPESGTDVSAEADFSFANGTLTITLKNLEVGIQNAGQLLAGLEFSVDGVTSGFTLAQSQAQLITVTGAGNGTTGATTSAGWGFGTNFNHALILCEICPNSASLTNPVMGGPPSHTIIGPGPFTSPNHSITGNHNPYLNQSVTFVINDGSFTPITSVSQVAFRFGTDASQCPVEGQPQRGPSTVPEPDSIGLSAAGIVGIAAFCAYRRSHQQS